MSPNELASIPGTDIMKSMQIPGTEGLLPGITDLPLTNVKRPENALKTKVKLLGTELEVYVLKAPLEGPVFEADSVKVHTIPRSFLAKNNTAPSVV